MRIIGLKSVGCLSVFFILFFAINAMPVFAEEEELVGKTVNINTATAEDFVEYVPLITPELAEKIVADGTADVVTMLRSTVADPGLVNKARRGDYEDIRPCVRCNTCINQPHYFFLPVRCAVNPEAGRECDVLRVPPPKKVKKIVIVGGGPAGLQAARTAFQLDGALLGGIRWCS